MRLTPFRGAWRFGARVSRPLAGNEGAARLAALVLGALLLTLTARADPPPGYYSSVDTSSSAALRAALHDVIDDHQRFPYTSSATDTWDILEEADQDALDAAAIRDVYRNRSFTKFGGGGGGYDREHAWPKSYGFPDDGSQNYPFTDCHHLFLSDTDYNGFRSNKRYGTCDTGCAERSTVSNGGVGGGSGSYPGESNWSSTDEWETWTGRRGNVARALLYLDVRYEGGIHGASGASEPDLVLTDDLSLVVTTATNAAIAHMAELSVLLLWHLEDPVDTAERNRNDVVYAYQGNRNPFVDHPEWAACVFASSCDDAVPPETPTSFTALGIPGAVELDWDDNAEPDLAGYEVWRAGNSGGPYARLNAALRTASDFHDAAAASEATYYYTVAAVDLAGNESAPSSEIAATAGTSVPRPWINEIHYDNVGTDAQEGFEIAGLAGTDLGGWQVATYNGSGGVVSETIDLGGVLADETNGYGFVWFGATTLQNGPADGLALVDPGGTVLEFLSYEGALTATSGPAAGLTSDDIGVRESSSSALDDSLQLQGSGDEVASFAWAGSAPHSRGAVNPGQTVIGANPIPSLALPARLALAALLLAAVLTRALRGSRNAT